MCNTYKNVPEGKNVENGAKFGRSFPQDVEKNVGNIGISPVSGSFFRFRTRKLWKTPVEMCKSPREIDSFPGRSERGCRKSTFFAKTLDKVFHEKNREMLMKAATASDGTETALRACAEG